MRKGGSVNQTEPSDLHTTSLGELRDLPSWRSATVVMVPSYSVRDTRRPPCSHVTSRPCRSRVLPSVTNIGVREFELVAKEGAHRLRLRGVEHRVNTGNHLFLPSNLFACIIHERMVGVAARG